MHIVSYYENLNSLQIRFLRYAGSKRRSLCHIKQYLQPTHTTISRYVDPFVGGGGVFLSMNFYNVLVSDIKPELMDLYRAIQQDPGGVWQIFESYPLTKSDYYRIRNDNYL